MNILLTSYYLEGSRGSPLYPRSPSGCPEPTMDLSNPTAPECFVAPPSPAAQLDTTPTTGSSSAADVPTTGEEDDDDLEDLEWDNQDEIDSDCDLEDSFGDLDPDDPFLSAMDALREDFERQTQLTGKTFPSFFRPILLTNLINNSGRSRSERYCDPSSVFVQASTSPH